MPTNLIEYLIVVFLCRGHLDSLQLMMANQYTINSVSYNDEKDFSTLIFYRLILVTKK